MRQATEEKFELLRTEENYSLDVETNNMTQTGVKTWSIFNSVPYFHIVHGTANELTHDLMEGSMPYCHHGGLKLLMNEGRYHTDRILTLLAINTLISITFIIYYCYTLLFFMFYQFLLFLHIAYRLKALLFQNRSYEIHKHKIIISC